MQAFEGVQVVKVRQLGAFGVERGLACCLVGKGGHHKGAADFHGGRAGSCDARVAFAKHVIVGAYQQAGGFVAGMQGCRHGGNVASCERNRYGKPGGLK